MTGPLNVEHEPVVQLLLELRARISLSLGRTPHPSRTAVSQWVVMFGFPSGALSAPHSPFAAVLARSQSGLKFRLASVQLRLALLMRVLTGLFAVAVATDSLAR